MIRLSPLALRALDVGALIGAFSLAPECRLVALRASVCLRASFSAPCLGSRRVLLAAAVRAARRASWLEENPPA